ncbi:MFS transporter [Saliterribacillus persicus]|uniref:MFS transporter n=1 Tax=Saliterribacillus persicus TaxID=930114 RepID=A0A368Y353_9BACI|nr:MFS transporter [Saliterribacillus persicus]RCW73257.1 MFS transporter [Saliterribacillus persicus]
MKLKVLKEKWKYPVILLLGIGVSNIGAWVYLLALNLIVFESTGSALAVAALYILIPLAAIFTNFWAGSITDRFNKRTLMFIIDISRAICIFSVPWLMKDSIWIMYITVFFINVAGAMYTPALMAYVTKLIPYDQRKRFNSLRSLIDSGAFLIGPAIAGLFFIMGSPEYAIMFNSVAMFLSGVITLIMPNVEKHEVINKMGEKLTIRLLKKDFQTVISFSRDHSYIIIIYFLFNLVIVMTAAVDSLEAAFAKEVLNLSDSNYGFLVSIAGAGIVIGACINAIFVKKISVSILMGLGSVLVSFGYIIYTFSQTFMMAAVGFFSLALFLAIANTAFFTFYQNNIPVEIMGRVSSLYGILEAILIIITTVLIGIFAQFASIQLAIIMGALIMLLISFILLLSCMKPSQNNAYQS